MLMQRERRAKKRQRRDIPASSMRRNTIAVSEPPLSVPSSNWISFSSLMRFIDCNVEFSTEASALTLSDSGFDDLAVCECDDESNDASSAESVFLCLLPSLLGLTARKPGGLRSLKLRVFEPPLNSCFPVDSRRRRGADEDLSSPSEIAEPVLVRGGSGLNSSSEQDEEEYSPASALILSADYALLRHSTSVSPLQFEF